MKIVVSPAKSLDYKTKLPVDRGTQPRFLEITEKINKKMERLSKPKLGELMDISEKLAALNYERYKNFEPEHNKKNSRAAMYAFAGDVYVGLDAYSILPEKIDKLQDTLRILSGMYGILRPLDLIQPYRLEMGTSIGINRKKDLYSIWKKTITASLNEEMKDEELFLNLASQEYFKSIETKKLKVPVITPVFKDMNKGDLKIISFYAKKARGAMVRYIIDKNVENVEDLKGFDYEGYRFSEKLSENPRELVFVR